MEYRLLRPGLQKTESLVEYREYGGYEALKSIQKKKSGDLIAEVEAAGLRGRGGSGFPTFRKWQAVSEGKGEHYLVCNATEGEPDSFKDRTLIQSRPHILIEGLLIAAKAIRANAVWVVMCEEFSTAHAALTHAILEARSAKLLGNVEIRVLTSPPRYVVGEETALLNWIEGKPAKPRFKITLPVFKGLWDQPTLVHNVETIMNLPWLFRNGADAYRSLGTESSPGTSVFTLQGDVNCPGLYEYPLGTSLSTLIEAAGGMKNQRNLNFVLIGGYFGGFLYGDALSVQLDYESVRAAGGSLGCGVIRVYDDTKTLEQEAEPVLNFFSEETCGQCGACYMGTAAMRDELRKYLEDHTHDVKKLSFYSTRLRRRGACGLIDGASFVAGTVVNYIKQTTLV